MINFLFFFFLKQSNHFLFIELKIEQIFAMKIIKKDSIDTPSKYKHLLDERNILENV